MAALHWLHSRHAKTMDHVLTFGGESEADPCTLTCSLSAEVLHIRLQILYVDLPCVFSGKALLSCPCSNPRILLLSYLLLEGLFWPRMAPLAHLLGLDVGPR